MGLMAKCGIVPNPNAGTDRLFVDNNTFFKKAVRQWFSDGMGGFNVMTERSKEGLETSALFIALQ